MDTLIAVIIGAVITLIFVGGYLKGLKKREVLARAAEKKNPMSSQPFKCINTSCG